jgi:hypothetical protein
MNNEGEKVLLMTPNKKTARFAGLMFLLMVVFGLFAEVFFRQAFFIVDDAAATAANIAANSTLYRAGIVSDIVMSLSYLFTALVLYKLLVSVNRDMASLMVLFAAAGSILLLSNVLNEFAPLYLISAGDQLSGLTSAQLQSLALLSYAAHGHGYAIGQVFFALWVLPLGVLIYKSRFIPRAFGILFVVQAVCGLLSVLVHFLIPIAQVETILLLPSIIAEFSFMFWLLIWGINESGVAGLVGLDPHGAHAND